MNSVSTINLGKFVDICNKPLKKMPASYEVDTFLGEVDTFFQKKTLYLPTKELLGNIPKNRIGKRQYIFTYYKKRLI
ncbi:hypothetical protein DW026_04915 [Segatella copri]|uniref:Uncharacterized protein n=1 Tax=Segatella copri TaxID=165179 RepID=A0AA92VC16_9BACT|nr:hypothetical protein DW026_04915 [Segatella copri]